MGLSGYGLVPSSDWVVMGTIVDMSSQEKGRFKNAYDLVNLRAIKIPMLYKNRVFQCMTAIFCVEFQRV